MWHAWGRRERLTDSTAKTRSTPLAKYKCRRGINCNMTFEEVGFEGLKFINLARCVDQWRTDEIFQKKSEIPFLTFRRNEGILEELKVEPVDQKLTRYKSNWLRHVTRTISNRMPKIMLNYRTNGRRHLGRPLKQQIELNN